MGHANTLLTQSPLTFGYSIFHRNLQAHIQFQSKSLRKIQTRHFYLFYVKKYSIYFLNNLICFCCFVDFCIGYLTFYYLLVLVYTIKLRLFDLFLLLFFLLKFVLLFALLHCVQCTWTNNTQSYIRIHDNNLNTFFCVFTKTSSFNTCFVIFQLLWTRNANHFHFSFRFVLFRSKKIRKTTENISGYFLYLKFLVAKCNRKNGMKIPRIVVQFFHTEISLKFSFPFDVKHRTNTIQIFVSNFLKIYICKFKYPSYKL